MPDQGNLEAALEYLEPLKPGLFEMKPEEWNRDRSAWPEELTGEVFDAWFDVQVYSMVWDLVVTQVE